MDQDDKKRQDQEAAKLIVKDMAQEYRYKDDRETLNRDIKYAWVNEQARLPGTPPGHGTRVWLFDLFMIGFNKRTGTAKILYTVIWLGLFLAGCLIANYYFN